MDLIRLDQPKLQEILRVLRVVPKSATNSSTVVQDLPGGCSHNWIGFHL